MINHTLFIGYKYQRLNYSLTKLTNLVFNLYSPPTPPTYILQNHWCIEIVLAESVLTILGMQMEDQSFQYWPKLNQMKQKQNNHEKVLFNCNKS